MDNRQRCLIAVCTFNRVDKLRDLLASIQQNCQEFDYRVAVVENDDSGRARQVAGTFGAEYFAEPQPGISAARNKCLSLLSNEDDFLIFVDDDEVVSQRWLSELLRVQGEYSAHVVAGPVLTVFPPNAPNWIIKGQFMDRKRRRTGAEIESVAAGNTLISAAAIRASRLTFDESFSFTGGEDTDYFRRMRPFTGSPIWADDAVASEEATPDRLTLSWLARRSFRNGSVTARIQLRTRSKSWVLGHSVAAIGKYSVLFVVDSVKRRAPSGPNFKTVVANAGRIAEVFQVRTRDEYQR